MLDVKAEVARLKDIYKSQQSNERFNFLIAGKPGTRKTWSIGATASAPVHIFSFDPGGTKHLRQQIEEGRLVVSMYEDLRDPSSWSAFSTDFDRMESSGYFNQFSSVALDSGTLAVEALSAHIAKVNGRANGILAIQDYQTLWNMIANLVSRFAKLPCDFYFTAHHANEKDELTGRLESVLNVPGQAKRRLSSLFDEVYVTEAKETPKGIDYTFLTQNNGIFDARSRMGGNVFSLREPQDFKALRVKAGREVPDKPLFT